MNIRTQIRIDINPSTQIRSQILSENIHTVLIHTHHDQARSKKKHEEAGVEEVVSKGRHLKIMRVADVWV